MTSQCKHKQTGFSLLELIVTLVILGIVMSAVLVLLQQTYFQIRHLNQDLSRRSLLNHSLDKLMDDLIENAKDNIEIQLKNSSTLTLKTTPSTTSKKPSLQIDWATASDHQNLVLYRRVMRSSKPKDILYYPICDQLESFTINMLDSQGSPVFDQKSASLIEVHATMFRRDLQDPEYVYTSRRTFSLKRFDF